jgi:hypothetical protein
MNHFTHTAQLEFYAYTAVKTNYSVPDHKFPKLDSMQEEKEQDLLLLVLPLHTHVHVH